MLSSYIWKTNIRVQKIDVSTFKTFGIVIADFQVENKVSRPKFLKETFLVANIKFEMIWEIFFLKLNNVNMSFNEKTLTLRSYTTNEAFFTTKPVWIIDITNFVIAALDANNKTFAVYMAI